MARTHALNGRPFMARSATPRGLCTGQIPHRTAAYGLSSRNTRLRVTGVTSTEPCFRSQLNAVIAADGATSLRGCRDQASRYAGVADVLIGLCQNRQIIMDPMKSSRYTEMLTPLAMARSIASATSDFIRTRLASSGDCTKPMARRAVVQAAGSSRRTTGRLRLRDISNGGVLE